jgi:cob(I)alamin adenosyltransferase
MMVEINKVYTRTGDQGETDLAGIGHRQTKNSARIHTIGDVDELNSALGLAIAAMTQDSLNTFKEQSHKIQHALFNLGSQLAVLPEDRQDNTPVVTQADTLWLETDIDRMNAYLTPLRSFILPGGGETAARLHMARSICRRAERSLVTLAQQDTLDGTELAFLNRLSDWLFVAARHANQAEKIKEPLWQTQP